jgi:hypothetical protein
VAVIFPEWTNRTPKYVVSAIAFVAVGVVFAFWYWASPKYTDAGYMPRQPVPFSHKQHAGDLGFDCRYCHNTIERAAVAAVPPTFTCMACHEKLILPESLKLAPVRTAFASRDPVPWVRVHMLPDYAYFDHSVHLAAGVGCATCHGRIDQMKTVHQHAPLSMSWCLGCHRDPNPNLRPTGEITNMAWDAAKAKYDPNKDSNRTRKLAPPTHCSGCHR